MLTASSLIATWIHYCLQRTKRVRALHKALAELADLDGTQSPMDPPYQLLTEDVWLIVAHIARLCNQQAVLVLKVAAQLDTCAV